MPGFVPKLLPLQPSVLPMSYTHPSNEIHNKMKSTNLVKLRIAAFMPQQGAPTQMMASFQHAALATRAGGLFL